ncbi:MAG: DUF1569 domain-containing protein [Planctomycetota bacterium]
MTDNEGQSPKRRELHFDSLSQAVAEIESLAKTQTVTVGKFSFPQIVDHFAHTFDISTGRAVAPKVPWLIRMIMASMTKRFATKPMKPGYQLPKHAQAFFWDHNATDLESAMTHFREAYQHYRHTDPLPRHPLFGVIPKSRNEQIQCRHMELHLSFVHPKPVP